jgi:hypothetical protein
LPATYPNKELVEAGAAIETLYIENNYGVAFYLDGKEFFDLQ